VSKGDDKTRILVVEDEESILEGVCDLLAFHGLLPTGAASGEEGLERGLGGDFDLVILDIMLPGMSGLDVCRRLRQELPLLPILMLTAKGSEGDIVDGLRCGADDYVTKPFSVRELVARVEALLRRASSQRRSEEVFELGPWQVDVGALQASADGQTLALTARECGLLSLLWRERGRVVSRRTLLQEVWRLSNVDDIETRTVDVHIAKLRKKIDRGARSLIETVRGAGYRVN
jgi:DNA-binding response OmpR family regulator